MVGKTTKLTGRWKLRSPRRRTRNNSNSGDAADLQQGVPATAWAPPAQEEDPGGTPAPSPSGQSQSHLPLPPRGSTQPERGRPKEHHVSDEFRLSDDEPDPLSTAGRTRVGGRSRSPLLGLRILAKNISRKSRPRDKEEAHGGGGGVRGGGGHPPDEAGTSSDNTTKKRLGPLGEPVQSKCPPEALLPRQDLTESMVNGQKAHTPVATAVEDDTTARGELIHAKSMLSDDQLKGGRVAKNKISDTAKTQRPQRAPPQIAFIGVFLNGIAVSLASYTPVGGADARALVKSLLLESSTPVLPGCRYTATGSALAVHMAVDHKNRVYACLVADDVPLSLAFSLLEEVQIDYLSSVSTLAFSTLEHSHNKQCQPQMALTVAKYEKVEAALGQEREARRQLGEGLLDIETSLSEEHKVDKGPDVVRLRLDVGHHAAALAATREALIRSSTNHAACADCRPLGRSRSCKVLSALAACVAIIFLAVLAARSVHLAV